MPLPYICEKEMGAGVSSAPEKQNQTQNVNVTALIATNKALQQEKEQQQKQIDELLVKLATLMATKGMDLFQWTCI